jgi:hypothetical protein
MPYRKTGFISTPRSRYIPYYAAAILEAFGDKFDLTVAECIKSMGRENIFLKNFFFERLLTIKHERLDGNPDLKKQFIILLADFLKSVGYIDTCPIEIDYIVDPVMDVEELIDRVMDARMPVYKATDLGGEFATIDTLMMFFAEVIRRNALILNERKPMYERFKLWIGSIGHKLLTQAGELSQTERSFLTIYCSTQPNTKGFMPSMLPPGVKKVAPIPAVENKDVLVQEVAALASAACLSGPCTSHMKLVSNAILEQLTYYYGPHCSELKSFVGYGQPYGPFMVYDMTPADAMPWLLESQIVGLSSTAANFMVRTSELPPFTLKVPLAQTYKTAMGGVAQYPDEPSFRLWLTNPDDVSKYDWDYPSKWRGRRINSLTDGGTMDYALADAAVTQKTAGGMQNEALDMSGFGLCWMTPAALTKLIDDTDASIMETFLLPGPNALTPTKVDMTAFYARFGTVQMLPAFSEFLQLPMSWFMQPNDRVVDYVASVMALTIEERIRFTQIIAIGHNCAVYTRLTQQPPPIDQMQLAAAMLNVKPTPFDTQQPQQ